MLLPFLKGLLVQPFLPGWLKGLSLLSFLLVSCRKTAGNHQTPAGFVEVFSPRCSIIPCLSGKALIAAALVFSPHNHCEEHVCVPHSLKSPDPIQTEKGGVPKIHSSDKKIQL